MIRVVLAEDQAMVRGAFAGLLDLEPDIEVVAVAEDGVQGLAAVAEHQPDVLVTDIEMPGMVQIPSAPPIRPGDGCELPSFRMSAAIVS